MPVFDLVTVNDNSETIDAIMQRVIGATQTQIEAEIANVSAGGPTSPLMINGVSAGNTIPNEMLLIYEQFYKQGDPIQHKTGLSLRKSLAQGGWSVYNGQGSS